MNATLRHHCRQLLSGRWAAGFSLEFIEGPTLIDQQYFDPKIELTFDTEEEARERNRRLAWNWRKASAPEVTLYERHA